ncbi:MAG: DNRLRE domain-containing protein, partial [Actinomycetota bacterium]|nr:DNRLRE domain-containing protein [Actinomycetota bacterium]
LGRVSQVQMSDAQRDPATGDPTHVGSAISTLTPSALGPVLVVAADVSYLTDPTTVYPVVLDPSVHLGQVNDMWIGSAGATGTVFGSTELRVGYDPDPASGGVQENRSFMQFDTSQVAQDHILSATLALQQWNAPNCTAKQSDIYALGAGFTSTTTWQTQPASIPTLYGSSTQVYGATGCSTNWVRYTVTQLVSNWANGNFANNGLLVRAHNESDQAALWRFRGMRYSDTTAVPSLAVTYNTPPAQPSPISPANGAWSSGSTALLQASGYDADNDSLTAHWFLQDVTSGAMVANGDTTSAVCGSYLCYSATGLIHLHSYQWWVYTTDTIDASPVSATFAFSADSIPPPTPQIVSSNYSADPNVWSAPSSTSNNFSWSGPDDGSGIAYWQYGEDVTPPTSSTSSTTLTWNPASGQHVLYVRGIDVAGNVGPISAYSFQIGSGGVTSPQDQDRTQASVTLTSTSPTSYAAVAYQYRLGMYGAFTQVPAGNVTIPGTTSNPTWPYAGSPGNFGPLNWNVAQTVHQAGGSDGLVQVSACFYVNTSQGSPSNCSAPVSVQLGEHAFGMSHATPSLGPGRVSLLTGDYNVSANDVSIGTYAGSLNIGRSLSTLDPAGSNHNRLASSLHDVETDVTGFATRNASISSASSPTVLGAHSLAVSPDGGTSGTSDTSTAPGGDIGGLRLGLTPGHSYTFSAMEYVPSSTGLGPDNAARGEKPVAFTKVGNGGYAELDGTAPTATNVWTPVSVSFWVPDGATEALIRLYNGFASTKTGSTVYYDNLVLSQTDVFGPGWTASWPGPATGAGDMTLEDDSAQGYVALTSPDGTQDLYVPNGTPNQFSGVGDAHHGSVLAKVSSTQFTLTDPDGTVTTWNSPTAGTWQVASVVEAGSAKTTTFSYDGDGRVSQILGPIPPGVTCTSPLTTVGCRTLTLTYSNVNTATGAGTDPATWGDQGGQVKSVTFTAADPAHGSAMTSVQVARYLYDSAYHLRAAWDPRLPNPLQTRYSYGPDGRLAQLSPAGLNGFSFAYDGAGRLSTVSRPDPAGGTDTQTVVYDVPINGMINGQSVLPPMVLSNTSQWGQTSDLPVYGAAIFPASHAPAGGTPGALAASDWNFGSIHYLDVNGREVNTTSYGSGYFRIGTTTYDNYGNVLRSLDAGGRDEALNPNLHPGADSYVVGQSSTSVRAGLLDTENSYSTDGTELTQSVGPMHLITLDTGAQVHARVHKVLTYDEGAPSGGPFRLVTTSTVSAQTPDGVDHETLTSHQGYAPIVSGDTSGWTLRQATSSTTVMPGNAANITHITRYDPQGRVTETRLPAGTGGGTAQTTQYSYYAPSSSFCPSTAMAGLLCGNGPAAQPTSGPNLPLTTTSYDLYANPVSVTEAINGENRTTGTLYDAAERVCETYTAAPSSPMTSLP